MNLGRMQPSVKWTLIGLASVLAVSFCKTEPAACTLWAAAGERTVGGGVLIAKNRDWTPEADEIRLADLGNGRRFVGLFPVRKRKKPSAVAGISETGLVFVTASAGSVPKTQREQGESGLSRRILSEFATVADVVENRRVFAGARPAIYLLADRKRAAWIEVAPGGRVAFRATDSGTLSHTNHYLAEELLSANVRIGRSSASRLDRIEHLLSSGPPRLGQEDFVAFSRDAHAGPDDSIWRTGSRAEQERSLATWIVSLPKDDGPPEIYIRLANPGEAQRSTVMRLDASFWKRESGILY